MEMKERVNILKREKNAVVLAHNYQLPEIQDCADILGDSLELSRICTSVDKDVIVFCGVRFMAETAKLLSPSKTVLLPAADAGCEMADMASPDVLMKMKAEHPNAAVVAYVNTTAEIKALSDICCTSANAADIVNSLKNDEIIFLPDRNLAEFVSKHTDKKIIPYRGFCYVHDNFNLSDVKKAREEHPDSILLVHPESPGAVADAADFVLSTGGMIKKAGDPEYKSFIVGTEEGMIYRLSRLYPEKNFYPLSASTPALCKNMKKTRIEDLVNSLENGVFEIKLDDETAALARRAIERMLSV